MAKFFKKLTKLFTKTKEEEETKPTLLTKRPHKEFVLSDFEILTTLGKGSFGRVRLVKTFGGEQKHFALKIMKKNKIIRLHQFEHVLSEVTLLNLLSCPFIVNMISHFQDENRLYVVMEFVSGGELFRLLRRVGKFNNAQTMFFVCELVLALEYLHGLKIMFRDLKPENVMLHASGHIKLVDFGLAKTITDRTYTLCGTAEYLAPEMIENQGHGMGVDWWALGVITYEMLGGQPPFVAATPFEVYKQICHKPKAKLEFEPKHQFNKSVRGFIGGLLMRDRLKRLGCGKGAKQVKKDKWFVGVDWDAVKMQQLEVPFLPDELDDDNLAGNFDDYPDSDEDTALPLNGHDREGFDRFEVYK